MHDSKSRTRVGRTKQIKYKIDCGLIDCAVKSARGTRAHPIAEANSSVETCRLTARRTDTKHKVLNSNGGALARLECRLVTVNSALSSWQHLRESKHCRCRRFCRDRQRASASETEGFGWRPECGRIRVFSNSHHKRTKRWSHSALIVGRPKKRRLKRLLIDESIDWWLNIVQSRSTRGMRNPQQSDLATLRTLLTNEETRRLAVRPLQTVQQ